MPAQTRFKARVTISGRTSTNWIPKPEFCAPHRTSLSLYRPGILCARYLLTENELGDGEDIDRFTLLQGVFTPSFSGVRTTEFLDFRIGFSIENLRAWRDYVGMQCLNENKSDSKKLIVCTCAAGSATQLPNLELKHFKTVAETPTKWMLLSRLDQLLL